MLYYVLVACCPENICKMGLPKHTHEIITAIHYSDALLSRMMLCFGKIFARMRWIWQRCVAFEFEALFFVKYLQDGFTKTHAWENYSDALLSRMMLCFGKIFARWVYQNSATIVANKKVALSRLGRNNFKQASKSIINRNKCLDEIFWVGHNPGHCTISQLNLGFMQLCAILLPKKFHRCLYFDFSYFFDACFRPMRAPDPEIPDLKMCVRARNAVLMHSR